VTQQLLDQLSVALTQSEEQPSLAPRQRWASRITEAWQSQIAGIFEVGSLLESAKAELRHGEWIALIERDLPFNRQTANKLMKIAKDDRLRNVSPGRHLPAHWTLLYDLIGLSDAQFEAGIASGAIHPRMGRKDIRELRGIQPRAARAPSLRDQLAEANREIERLRRSGGDFFGANDSPRDIATVLFNTVNSVSKIDRIITELRRLQRERER
jgi:hypothetical protein